MRTTVQIADHLLIQAKKLAATRRTSLAKVLEDSLRKYLVEYRSQSRDQKPSSGLPLIKAGEALPHVDLNDTSQLMEL